MLYPSGRRGGALLKRFQFNLEPLLKVALRKEQEAERRLFRARLDFENAKKRLAQLNEELGRLGGVLEESVGRVLTSEEWNRAFARTDLLRRAIDAAQKEADARREALLQALEARKKMAIEVESLRSLRQKRWHEYQQEVQRRQHETLGEVGMRGWQQAEDPMP
jgi:flagellar export protein FliJ